MVYFSERERGGETERETELVCGEYVWDIFEMEMK